MRIRNLHIQITYKTFSIRQKTTTTRVTTTINSKNAAAKGAKKAKNEKKVEGKCRWQMRLASRFPFEARAARVCVTVRVPVCVYVCIDVVF